MTSFRVDLEQLDLLIERLAATQAQLRDVHDDVQSRMQRVQVVWSGRAATEHQAAFQHWSAGALETHEALLRLREIARTAHSNYAAAVAANRSMWAL